MHDGLIPQDSLNSLDCLASLCRTYQFPEGVAFKITFSRDRSATNFFNLAFSLSSSLSLRTWVVLIPHILDTIEISLFTDAKGQAGLVDGSSMVQKHFGFTDFVDDLFGGISFSWYLTPL